MWWWFGGLLVLCDALAKIHSASRALVQNLITDGADAVSRFLYIIQKWHQHTHIACIIHKMCIAFIQILYIIKKICYNACVYSNQKAYIHFLLIIFSEIHSLSHSPKYPFSHTTSSRLLQRIAYRVYKYIVYISRISYYFFFWNNQMSDTWCSQESFSYETKMKNRRRRRSGGRHKKK